MSSKTSTDTWKVSRVRPVQRATVARPLASGPTPAIGRAAGTETRQKQLASEQSQQIRDLELQVAILQKKNVDLQREMHEALGLQQIKSRAVEALNKDLHSKTDLERRVNDFLLAVSMENLEAVTEELMVLRKKCSRSEEYLAELNERYREAELRNKKLRETVAGLKAELAVYQDKGQAKKGDKCEELRNLVKRNSQLEQSCEALSEYKEKLVKLEIEKRDLKAENTQYKGKVTSLQRDKKQLQEKLGAVELDANQKLKEMKDAQARHLEMLSKLRRSHTKIDAKYKHLLKERAQWQSLFRTANGELSRSTESLASISSLASSSVSRSSFYRDSSNLEEYNIHLESELVAVQEFLKIAEKDKERLDRKVKTLAEQVVEDENLIAELDLNRSHLVEERDCLAQKCSASEEKIAVLQKTVDELREQLDTTLFENNEMCVKENEVGERESLLSSERLALFENHAETAEKIRLFHDSVLMKTKEDFDRRLSHLDAGISGLQTACDTLQSRLVSREVEHKRLMLINAEYERQIEVLKNNAESLAKDLSAEVRERSNTKMMKLQDQVNAHSAKLKDYEKMQKVLKKALLENEKLKDNENLLKAEMQVAEARGVELESQRRSSDQLFTENNGQLSDSLRRAEQENERLQDEFSHLKKQISELSSTRDALEAMKNEKETSKAEIDVLALQLSKKEKEIERLTKETESNLRKHSESSARAEALKITLAEKARQMASLIQDLERERQEKVTLTETVSGLREECQRHVEEKDSKFANLAEGMRKVNCELNEVLRDKAHKIEDLESQVKNFSEVQLDLEKSQAEVCKLEQCVQSSLKCCRSFVAAHDIPVDPGLELGDFVAHMTKHATWKWISNQEELASKEAELSKIKLQQEQKASFNETILQLQEQLEKDQHSLKCYEEILSTQSQCIEKMKFERQQLEEGMNDLRIKDSETIDKLQTTVSNLGIELEQSNKAVKSLSNMEARCIELEAQLAATTREKNLLLADLQEQLNQKTLDLEAIKKKLKALDALSVMEERLNAMSDERTKCHNRIEALSKEIADKDEKIRGKNQVIHELETELSERIATFDQMAKVFDIKGEEYKRVREMLSSREEHLALLSKQMSAVEPALKLIFEKLRPNEEFQYDSKLWNSLSEDLLQSLGELADSTSKIAKLGDELNGTRNQREQLSQELRSQEIQLLERTQASESLELMLNNSNEALGRNQMELTQTLETLESLKLEMQVSAKTSSDRESDYLGEISNLRKLLVESESVVNDLSSKRNSELANLMDKIRSLTKENEEQQNRFKIETGALRADHNELLAKFNCMQESATRFQQENVRLESDSVRILSELETIKADRDEKASELEELTKNLATKQSDMSRFEEKLHVLKDKYGEKLQTLQKGLLSCQAEKASLTNTVSQLEEQLRQSQRERAALSSEVSQLNRQVNGLENKEFELESSLKDKCESLEALRHEMDFLEQRTQEACSQYEETELKLTEREAEVSRLVDDLANLRIAFSERCEDVNSYHDHVKALAEEKVRHEDEIKILRKQISDNSDEYQAEALEMQQELSIMTERYNIKCHECEKLVKDMTSKAAEIKRFNTCIDSLKTENHKLTRSLEKLEKQLEVELNKRDLASMTTRQLEQEKDHLKDTLRSSTEEVSASRADALQKQEELNTLQELLEARNAAHRLLDEQVKDLRCQLEEKSKALSSLEQSSSEALDEVKAQFENSQRELSHLMEINDVNSCKPNEELEKLRVKLAEMESTAAEQVGVSDGLRALYKDVEVARLTLKKQVDELNVELEVNKEALSQLENTSGLRRNELRLELLAVQKELSCSREESQQSKIQFEKDLEAVHEQLKTEQLALTEKCAQIDILRGQLADEISAKQVLKCQLAESNCLRDSEAAELGKLEESSKLSLHKMGLEVADKQKQLHQALKERAEATQSVETTVEFFRKEEDQNLAFFEGQESLDRSRGQLEQSEGAQVALKKELKDSHVELDPRTMELAELQKLSNVSRNELKPESAVAENELILSRTTQEGLEIRHRLEMELEFLGKQLSTKELAVSQLGSGLLKVRDELNSHLSELSEFRQAVVEEQKEFSASLFNLSEKLCATLLHDLRAGPSQHLVDGFLETLKQHHAQSVTARNSPGGENQRAPESLDTFDVYFQTFNGPTAQFVAEQQASSTAVMKKLAAAMERDDTAPDQHKLHLRNGDTTGTIKVDPFDTIKQQRILIQELMAKLETTKKVLDGEVSRRKELDHCFKTLSIDHKLHNAQVSFDIAQLSPRDDTFDSAPIMDSQKQLIPETSLHVTRQFPTYVESFIRWLVSSAPPRSPETLRQN